MGEKEEKSVSIPWLPLITLIGVGSGVLLFFPQLTSSRPGGGDPRLADNKFDDQTVDARLWQDPLGVALADDDKKKNSEAHSITWFQGLLIKKWLPKLTIYPLKPSFIYPLEKELRFAQQAKHVQILAVMIPGGPYVEDVERRLRSRRAVIEGLGTSGYYPEKAHEIGYFCVPWLPLGPDTVTCVSALEKERNKDQVRPPGNQPGIQPARCNRKKPVANGLLDLDNRKDPDPHTLLVPYEWCEPKAPGAENASLARVLVLWLTDDAFGDAPLARLADFISWFRFKLNGIGGDGNFLPLPTFTVLGPDNSGTLRRMVTEAESYPWNNETRRCLATTHIYSSQASAAESQLLSGIHFGSESRIPLKRDAKNLIEQNLNRPELGSGFRFDRTNILDDRIVDTLWQELKLRGIKPYDHVAIISEEDTFYARALSATFTESNRRTIPIENMHSYAYLRGIDGKLPSDEKDQNETKGATENGGKNTQAPLRPTEHTEGLNQADDIRRLAEELKNLDASCRQNGNRASLKAVGLLGSDVYDKLELLKALRPVLPEAVFFTNHLDARLAHPDEWKETHNLVIVSESSLSINESLNKQQEQHYQNVAPFRDGGQTALYEATLEAMGKIDAQDVGIPRPLVFEIGRNGSVPKELPVPRSESTIAELLHRYGLGVGGFIVCVSLLFVWAYLVSRVAHENSKPKTEPEM